MKTCSGLPYAIMALLGQQLACILQFSFPYLVLLGCVVYFIVTLFHYCSLLLSLGEEVAGQAVEVTCWYGLVHFVKNSLPLASSLFAWSATDALETALPPMVDFASAPDQSWVTTTILGLAGSAGLAGYTGASGSAQLTN